MNSEMRAQIRDVNLNELQKQFRGAQYRKLVQQHLRKVDSRLEQALSGAVEALTDQERTIAEGLIDEYNCMGYDRAFWRRDLGDVFQEICDRFGELVSHAGAVADSKVKFNMFQIITMNFALQARDQPKLREFMGISTPVFPWVSASSLLYPIAATVYIATETPAKLAMVLGYGLSNLGYLLLAAGILKGTFRVFGLKKRWQVFVAAVIAFLVGTFLSNVSV